MAPERVTVPVPLLTTALAPSSTALTVPLFSAKAPVLVKEPVEPAMVPAFSVTVPSNWLFAPMSSTPPLTAIGPVTVLTMPSERVPAPTIVPPV